MTSDILMVHQPLAIVKHTGPIPQRLEGPSRAASAIPPPNRSVAHTPLDLQSVEDIFNLNTVDDTISVYQYSASEARTPTLPPTGAQRRSSRSRGKFRGGDLEYSSSRRFRRNDRLPHPDGDVLLGRANPTLSPSVLSGSLAMVTILR